MVWANEIHKVVQFDTFESLVDVNHMLTWRFHESNMLSLSIEMMIYLYKELLVVMLIQGLDLLGLFMVLWTSSTFLFKSCGKDFFIFKISLMLSEEAWA